MTNYTWTDDAMRSGTACDVDKVADNLMHLKYNAGGLLQINDLGTKTSNFTLDVNKIDLANITASVTISLPSSGLISGVENKCILDFTTTNASSPTLPIGLKWSNQNGSQAPTSYSTLSAVRNVLTFTTIDEGTTWEAEYSTYGGVVKTFEQPTLTSDGTLGGLNFAVYANNTQAGYEAYKCFDNNSSTYLDAYYPAYLIFYNPIALKVTQLEIVNSSVGYTIANYTLYGSNDNLIFTSLTSGTNLNTTGNSAWDITVPAGVQDFYKYYKLYVASGNSGSVYVVGQLNISAQYIEQ